MQNWSPCNIGSGQLAYKQAAFCYSKMWTQSGHYFVPSAYHCKELCYITINMLKQMFILIIITTFVTAYWQILKHEILIQNQVLFIQPPVERVREHLISELHIWVGIITLLPRIQSSRYQVGTVRNESLFKDSRAVQRCEEAFARLLYLEN